MSHNTFPTIGSAVEVLGEGEHPDYRGKVIGYDYCPDYLAWYVVVSLADGQTWYCDPRSLVAVQ